MRLEDPEIVALIKELFAPNGGAEREHNATLETLGFGLIHYALVTNLRPENVLVVGSRYGYIPSVIGLALKNNDRGRLDFVDANYEDCRDGFEVAFGGVGYWGAGHKRFQEFGVQDIIHVHLMRSEDFFKQCEISYDYIYLDGDHSYEGCRFDLEQAMAVATPTAFITLHDVLVSDKPFAVDRVFSEVDRTVYDTVVLPVWPGLGIIHHRRKIP